MGRGWLALAALAALAVMPTAEAATAPRGPAIAGVTTFTARTPVSRTVVEVPRPVAFSGSCFPESAVSVTGSAEQVMLVLIQRGTKGAGLAYFGRFPRREGSRTFSSMCGSPSVLAAGTYDVVLLRSAGTARVTLRTSLPGRAAFTPTHGSRAVIASLDTAFATDDASGTVVGSNGAQHVLAGRGLIVDAGWVQNGKTADLQSAGDCIVSQTPAAVPDDVAYAPGCPAGDSGSSIPGPAGAGQQYIGGSLSNIPTGPYADSVYYVNAGVVSSAGGVAAWIPFDN